MKKLVAILLAVSMILITPAFAVNMGEITADPVAVKGKGTAESVVQILENKNNTSTGQNITTETPNTATELEIAGNNASVTSTKTRLQVQIHSI